MRKLIATLVGTSLLMVLLVSLVPFSVEVQGQLTSCGSAIVPISIPSRHGTNEPSGRNHLHAACREADYDRRWRTATASGLACGVVLTLGFALAQRSRS